MKKWMAGLILILLLTACSSKLPQWTSEEEVKVKGEEIIQMFNQEDTGALVKEFAPQLQAQVTDEVMEQGYEVKREAGDYQGIKNFKTKVKKSRGDEYLVVIYQCEYEDKNLQYTMTYTSQMELGALYVK